MNLDNNRVVLDVANSLGSYADCEDCEDCRRVELSQHTGLRHRDARWITGKTRGIPNPWLTYEARELYECKRPKGSQKCEQVADDLA